MQLLLERNQRRTAFDHVKFSLWVKFELTEEEKEWLKKTSGSEAILYVGNFMRDLRRSVLWGFFPGLLFSIYIGGFFASSLHIAIILLLPIIFIPLAILIVYQMIRETVYVRDVITGRHFSCRDVLTLLEKERSISAVASQFRSFLELAKTWGGRELIEIGPHGEASIRHTTPSLLPQPSVPQVAHARASS